jgi:type I restriction enzyme S subunit
VPFRRIPSWEIDAKVGGFGIVPDLLDRAIVSSHYFLFVIDEQRLDRRFLDYFIRTPTFRDQVEAQGSTNYAAIRPADVLGYRMVLPPLSEQWRVVKQIEDLVGQIREARALRQEATEGALALMGARLGAKFAALAKSFSVEPLSNLASHIIDGPHVTPHYLPEGVRGIPFVTVKNMVTGTLYLSDLNYISESDHDIFTRRCKPERGDVLYSKDGATRGRPCLVDTDREFSFFVSVALIKPLRDRLDSRYLVHLLNSNWIKARMEDKSRGDMIPHIVLREIRAFPVPIPPLAEQRSIVSEFDRFQAEVDALKRLQIETAAELDALVPAVLDRAFKGEL